MVIASFCRRCASFVFALCLFFAATLATASDQGGKEGGTRGTADSIPSPREKSPSDDTSAAEEETKAMDPFAIPEKASAEELFEFIGTVKRNRGQTIQSVSKSARAAVTAAEAIRSLNDVSIKDEIRAVREQLGALGFLSQFEPDSREQMVALVRALKSDGRPEMSKLGVVEDFKLQTASAREASKEQQLEMVDGLKALIADKGFDRETYTVGSGLARAIGYSSNADVAADLYDYMAVEMQKSDDVLIRERAGKMVGAARLMRLPGNFMEVTGTTTDGNEFNWDSYRGRVVLVDFWASWCGPCRREVPNMKRNLERYHERGFDIVGVNLDRTLADCQDYVEREGLSWPNLISDEEGQRGWDHPLAARYGISAIPTAILVDQEGKVISLRARGDELDRLLEEMLGSDVEIDETSSQADADNKAAAAEEA